MNKYKLMRKHWIWFIRYNLRKILLKIGFRWEGPYTKYKAALRRDNYTCQTCRKRSRKKMTIHHKNGNHEDNRLENLATLCRTPCHDEADKQIKSFN